MFLDPLLDRFEKLALPVGQRNARLLCRAAGALQGVQSLALGCFTLQLIGRGERLFSRELRA
jgi:hypothetical protein